VPESLEHTSNKFWFPLAFAFVLILGILLGIKLQKEVPMVPVAASDTAVEGNPGKIEELLRYIEARYVDDVDRDELVQNTIDHLLKELDPHSIYIPSDQLQRFNEQLEGNFEGIGIEFLIVEDTIVVIKPTKDGPSDKAGILIGDKIISVGDSSIVGEKLIQSNIIDSLRGKEGTVVNIGILREGQSEVQYFEVTRGEIPIYSVDASYMLNKNTGYIKINRFSSTTHTEFLSNLERMVDEEGLENVVIDLRDNGGGYLQEATSILNQFFKEKDRLLVYTEGRNVHRSDYETTGKSFFSIDNIAVLVDEGSGSAIRLTIARYYTPSGRSIQRDYDNTENYDNEITARLRSGELYSGEQGSSKDTTKYYTQEGRVVYGGGGIIPDVFVPLDSSKTTPYFAQIQPLIRTFMYKYYQANKKGPDGGRSIFDHKDLEDFVDNFEISDQTYDAFQASIDDEKLRILSRSIKDLKSQTKLYLKARLAKHLYDENGLYAVLNSDDDVVKKALQILEMPNPTAVLEEE